MLSSFSGTQQTQLTLFSPCEEWQTSTASLCHERTCDIKKAQDLASVTPQGVWGLAPCSLAVSWVTGQWIKTPWLHFFFSLRYVGGGLAALQGPFQLWNSIICLLEFWRQMYILNLRLMGNFIIFFLQILQNCPHPNLRSQME